MAEADYEAIGKFIYATCRVGGNMDDLANWMADDLGVPRLPPGGDQHTDFRSEVYRNFFAKHSSGDDLQQNLDRYMESLKK